MARSDAAAKALTRLLIRDYFFARMQANIVM